MTDFPATFPAPETDEELIAAMDDCFEQIKRLREEMDKDQADIDRLKNETRTLLTQLKAA